MQNGNYATKVRKSDIADIDFKKKNVDALKKDIGALMRNFKCADGMEKPNSKEIGESMQTFKHLSEKQEKTLLGCFFLKSVDINILTNIPNFQGISIYIGEDDKGQEILILIPVIRGSDDQNVYSQTYTVNGEEKTTSTVVTLPAAPCPPYPPPCPYHTCCSIR